MFIWHSNLLNNYQEVKSSTYFRSFVWFKWWNVRRRWWRWTLIVFIWDLVTYLGKVLEDYGHFFSQFFYFDVLLKILWLYKNLMINAVIIIFVQRVRIEVIVASIVSCTHHDVALCLVHLSLECLILAECVDAWLLF